MKNVTISINSTEDDSEGLLINRNTTNEVSFAIDSLSANSTAPSSDDINRAWEGKEKALTAKNVTLVRKDTKFDLKT